MIMYWDKILKDALNKKLANARKMGSMKHGAEDCRCKKYPLGPKFDGKYFTRREAECMVLLLAGKTIPGAAAALGLSPRTIEFYLKRMKAKLGCRTKSELIEIVLISTFLENPPAIKWRGIKTNT